MSKYFLCKVTKVDKNGIIIDILYPEEVKNVKLVHSETFFPVMKYDSLEGNGILSEKKLTLDKGIKVEPSIQKNEIISLVYMGIERMAAMPSLDYFFSQIEKLYGKEDFVSSINNYVYNGSRENFGMRDIQRDKVITFWKEKYLKRQLYLMGLSKTDIFTIKLGEADILNIIRENPFRLYQLPYSKLLKIYSKFFKKKNSDLFTVGQFVHNLYEKSDCCFPYYEITDNLTDEQLKILESHFDLKVLKFKEDLYLYFPEQFSAEKNLLRILRELLTSTVVPIKPTFFGKRGVSSEQKQCITEILRSPVSILTGRAGTGKTTVIREILENLREPTLICCPTGKAVSRLEQSLIDEEETFNSTLKDYRFLLHKRVMTIHYFLSKFASRNPEISHLIIDEASMVTTDMLANLLCIVKPKTLLLVGDSCQLEPVGKGNMFTQLLESKKIPTFELTQNFRAESQILMEVPNSILQYEPRFLENEYTHIHNTNDLTSTVCKAKELYSKGISPFDITIITYRRETVDIINTVLQTIYMENELMDFPGGKKFSLGDRVMITENNYDLEVYNGQEGKIVSLNSEEMKISIADRVVTLNNEKHLKYVDLCYALTIHKSQGTGWKYVIFVITDKDYIHLNRKSIYTALTRSKKEMWIFANMSKLEEAAKKEGNKPLDLLAKRL